MKNKLCCVLSEWISCDACEGKWCYACWADITDGKPEWGDNKYAGHKALHNLEWMCPSGKRTTTSSRDGGPAWLMRCI